MDLREQLEAMGLYKGTAHLRPAIPHRTPSLPTLVVGEEVQAASGAFFLAAETYEPAYIHGRYSLGTFLGLRRDTLARLAGEAALANVELGRLVFLDTETTGLAGGTGTYAFLVGIGSFLKDGRFWVRQYFMRDYHEEPAMLEALGRDLAQYDGVVSFNGKAFDLPLVRTRFTLARQPFPLADPPHLDLLFPSRRLWQKVLSSCALFSLEMNVLQVRRNEEEVPGYLIPTLYFEYLRTGDPSPLAGIFYHNKQDLLSLVSLAVRLSLALEDPWEAGCQPGEILGVARMYEDAGLMEECAHAYAGALQGALSPNQEEWAMRRLAALYKRTGKKSMAVDIWSKMLDDEGSPPLYPYVELAKHYEWSERNPLKALELVHGALEVVSRWAPSPARRQAMIELEHRRRRLERKTAPICADVEQDAAE